jgi:acid phosphatase type 7
MKRLFPAIPAIIGALLIAAFIAWAFSLHGTVGFYRVNGFFRHLFLYLGFYGLAMLLLSLLYLWLKTKVKGSGFRWLAVLLFILAVPGIVIPSLAFIYTNGGFSGSIGDTPPQLWIAEETGGQGIPNLAVTFNTDAPSKNTLTWGKSDSQITLSENKYSKQHVFMLRDLEPASEYTYRINDSASYSFDTPAADRELHFAMSSDAHFGAGNNRADLTTKMLAAIADPDNHYDIFFFGGDLVEYGFNSEQWGEAFRTFSTATSSVPARYALGNHESLFTGLGYYEKYAREMALQTGSRLWYRIDIGKIHFLVLDIEWSAESYSNEQAEWLEAQLRNIPAGDWKIVISHGFYYASGSYEDGWKWYDNTETINALAPLFEKYGVDLVFSGHDHHMELLQHNSVTYIVCGAFGGLPDPLRTYISPASIWYLNEAYGFADITIKGNQGTVVFRDSNFEALETFTLEKHR